MILTVIVVVDYVLNFTLMFCLAMFYPLVLLVLKFDNFGVYCLCAAQKPILSWTEKLSIALGIVEGLKYLRAANIIHRNPNSSNILLDKSLVPKIAGFSLSLKAYKVKEEEGLHISFLGTQGYTDPDYRSQGAMSTTVDIYIFGVVLMELITGKPPVAPVTDTLLVTEVSVPCVTSSICYSI